VPDRTRPLTGPMRMPILRRNVRPRPHLRHLPRDYLLAIHAGCGRLYLLIESFGRPASEAERLLFRFGPDWSKAKHTIG
jgi:hypothetical protein